MTEKTRAIIEKWYKKLEFDSAFDKEFYKALDEIDIPEELKIADYDASGADGRYNLLSYLYICEEVAEKYREMDISEEILVDTLYDTVLWTRNWSKVKGEIYLGELGWLRNHVSLRLHKLGRLQFCRGRCEHDIPELGVKEGDPVLEIHIPAVGPLTPGECERSITRAKEFYARFYPEYDYKCFTCHSWLLDSSLKELLGEGSNILRFASMFTVTHEEVSDAIFKYVFKWDTRRDTLQDAVPASSFAERVKKRGMEGAPFRESFGYIAK